MSRRLIPLLALAAGLSVSPCGHAVETFDVVITDGLVFDGSGAPGRRLDVGIRGDRIVAVGALAKAQSPSRIDATGLVVAPGFIDIHSHAVRTRVDNSGIFLWPDAQNYIRQGVTTAIGGPDGLSWYPVGELLEMVAAAPAAVNFGSFVGHNAVRGEVMGRADRAPTTVELDAMRALVARAMEEGAFGLSSGLRYVPGAYADTAEVVELAKVAGRHGGIYISHLRDEGTGVLDAVREAIRIGEEGGLPAQVTHHKVMGKSMWGRTVDTLALVDAARARGLDVSSDVYPYTASSTGIKVLFPAWVLEGDRAAREARLRDPEQHAAIVAGLEANLATDRGGNDLERVAIASCSWNTAYNGRTLGALLAGRGRPQTLREAAELLIELELGGSCTAVYHSMDEADVIRILLHPATMVASDGGIAMPGPDVPHPRNYGAFARVLGVYVRERGLLSLAEALHKMTGMPAARLGLADRGRIAPGAWADVVVLDPDSIGDRATFAEPHQFSVGVRHVFVNGEPVLAYGQSTGARPGRVLRLNRVRPAKAPSS